MGSFLPEIVEMISILNFSLLVIAIGAGAEIVPGQWTDVCAISEEFANSPCCVPNTEGSMVGYEFEWLNLELSWKNAQDECREEDDTSDSTLVIFESPQKRLCIIEWLSQDPFLVTQYHDFAIGLHKSSSAGGQYEWDTTDGTEPFPTWTFPWASGFPEDTGCVYTDIGYGAPEAGFFKDTDCYDGQRVFPICQRTKVSCHGVTWKSARLARWVTTVVTTCLPARTMSTTPPPAEAACPAGRDPHPFKLLTAALASSLARPSAAKT